MKIRIICVGKKHEKTLADAIAEYEKRLSPYCDFGWEYVPAGDIKSESEGILKLANDYDFVVLLDENGLPFSSDDLAKSLEKSQNSSYKKVAIIIGGAYGVNRNVVLRASVTLSLSKLVFPHQIVRLIIVEQIYRAYSILAGSNYHHR